MATGRELFFRDVTALQTARGISYHEAYDLAKTFYRNTYTAYMEELNATPAPARSRDLVAEAANEARSEERQKLVYGMMDKQRVDYNTAYKTVKTLRPDLFSK